MELIQIGHGSGGRMMHSLLREYFVPAFSMAKLHDAAVVENPGYGRIAITTDSYVISPYFFPGGDIGMLSVCGTVNDLAMSGAVPLYLTAGFILEEGFPVRDLETIIRSMRSVADRIGVRIIAGDTKVVERGKGDGIFINTAGFGIIDAGIDIAPGNIRPGDRIILSGPIGNHGISVMAKRNGITFEPPLLSDVSPLSGLVAQMLRHSPGIHVLRDPTRGGLATTLKELAVESGLGLIIDESALTVTPGVRGACDLLGLDPLYVANEGILICCADPVHADGLVAVMRSHESGHTAAIIGEVAEKPARSVLLRTVMGGSRILDMLPGEQLPRIC